MQVHDVRVIGKGHDKLGHRTADIADHHAADDQQRHSADFRGEQQNQAHREHRAAEGRPDQRRRAQHPAVREGRDQRQGDGQLGAGGDAQHEGPRDRVEKEGLQQKARHRQRAAEESRCEQARQAQRPDHARGALDLPAGAQNPEQFGRCHLYGTREQIGRDENEQQQKQQKEGAGIAPCLSVHASASLQLSL